MLGARHETNAQSQQDNTIIATAIPRITDQFNAVNDVGWYGAAYLLTTCCLQLIFGKLYTFYSIKWVYLTALFIFELGSFVCGITPNSVGLIMGRAVAGIGAAGIFTGATTITAIVALSHIIPQHINLLLVVLTRILLKRSICIFLRALL